MNQVLAFNKWDCSDIQVVDPGLKKYINVSPTIVPKTGATYAGNRFHKSKTFIVERLINKVMLSGHKGKKHCMSSGHNTGKGARAYGIVEESLNLIEGRTKKNPIEVLVRAIESASPREEVITVEYAGARYPKAVEAAPQRRIDTCLRLFVQGAAQAAFKKKKTMSQALADQIVGAFENDNSKSLAVSKKFETERQADASR